MVVQAARRRSTIIEVAARANVAFSTVSRVLNGGYASPEVRARVELAARELNYTPSPIARNLKTGRQGCIGVVVESSQCSWFTQVLGGIEEALADKTVSALLGSLNLRGSYDATTIERWIADRRVDGLIFARCTRREESLVAQARNAQLPMVFIAPDENFSAGPVFVARNREADSGPAKEPKTPMWQRLTEVKVPLLLIFGREDRARAADRAHLLKQRVPSLDVHIVPECKHLVPWDAADQWLHLALPVLKK